MTLRPRHRQRSAALLLAAAIPIAFTACESPTSPPICPRSALSSFIIVTYVGYVPAHADAERLDLDVCVEDIECADTNVVLAPLECRVDASLGTTQVHCMLDGVDLELGFNLDGTVPELEGEHTIELTLDVPGGETIERTATVDLVPTYGHGPECGITHVEGRLDVDAATLEPLD